MAVLNIKIFVVLLYCITALFIKPYAQFSLNITLLNDLGYCN
jgi:hypothetical protein